MWGKGQPVHSVALTLGGRVYHFGELFESEGTNLVPTRIVLPRPVIRIIGLPRASVAITDKAEAYVLEGEQAAPLDWRARVQIIGER